MRLSLKSSNERDLPRLDGNENAGALRYRQCNVALVGARTVAENGDEY